MMNIISSWPSHSVIFARFGRRRSAVKPLPTNSPCTPSINPNRTSTPLNQNSSHPSSTFSMPNDILYRTLPSVVLCNRSCLDLSSSLLHFSRFTFSTQCSDGPPVDIATLLSLPAFVLCLHHQCIFSTSPENSIPDNAHSDPQTLIQGYGNLSSPVPNHELVSQKLNPNFSES